MSFLTLTKAQDLAWLEIDDPDDKVNTLKESLLEDFEQMLDQLEAVPDFKALILISGKTSGFIVGADIQMFAGFTDAGQAKNLGLRGHRLLGRIAALPRPVIAAIHGPALGGGLEMALACHYRIATDDRQTKFALPEVQLGVLPGLGGTQRLPRLIGLRTALDMLLTGKNIYAHRARKMGLVDRLIHGPGLREAAARFALEVSKKPLKRGRRRSLVDRLLEGNPLGRALVFRTARKTVLKKTAGNYPAPPKIIDSVSFGFSKGLAKGLIYEAEQFDALVRTPESRNLVRLFFAMTASKKNDRSHLARPVERLAVLGAGLMGSGIAEISAQKELWVTLKDLDEKALARSEKRIWDHLDRAVKKRALTPFERDRTLSRVQGVTDTAQMSKAELVIEAVFEDLELKRSLLAEVEAHCSRQCVFASNTSSLPIAEIAAHAAHPDRVIGMHYFSPVPKMPLLEIIVTEQTSEQTLATAVGLGARQGKNMIVVKDGPGFYTTRILAPMLNEAVLLLQEGAAIEAVDRAMIRFGFPVGPITLMDEVGIDVGAHVGEVLGGLFAQRGIKGDNTMARLHEAGYKGRKNNRGFYLYGRKRKRINAEIYRFFGGGPRKNLGTAEIQERLWLVFANEAAYCLGEGIIRNPSDGDLGAILGLGFPPFLGGPFRFMDQLGLREVHDRLQKLRDRFGARFSPAPVFENQRCSFYGS